MSKSYSDVRMELERIANQRRSFIQNSDILRTEIVNSRKSFDATRQPVATFLSQSSSPGMSLSEKLSMSASMSEIQHPVNIYFRDDRDRSVLSSNYSPNTASFRRDLDRSITPSHSPRLAAPNQFQSSASPHRSITTASSVIGTFRQLQARSRKVEQERADAMCERDDLRRLAEEHLNNLEMWRRQTEDQTAERFQSMRIASDELVSTRRELELKILSLQEVFDSTQHSNSADRGVLLSLETERADIRSITHTVSCTVNALEAEMDSIANRCNQLSELVGTGSASNQQHKIVQDSIKSVNAELDSENRSKVLLDMRCGALQHYAELIQKINSDLSSRIEEKEGGLGYIRSHNGMEGNHSDTVGNSSDNFDDKNRIVNESRTLSAPSGTRTKNPKSKNSKQSKSTESVNIDGRKTVLNMNELPFSSIRGNSRTFRGSADSGVRFSLDTAYRALSADPYKRRLHSTEYANENKNSNNDDENINYVTENIKSISHIHNKNKNNPKYDRKKNGHSIQSVRCRRTSALTSNNASRKRTNSQENISSSSNLTRYVESRPDSRMGSRSQSPIIRTHRSGSSVGSATGTESGSTVHSEYQETVWNKNSNYTDAGRTSSSINAHEEKDKNSNTKEKVKEKDKSREKDRGEGRIGRIGGGGGVGFIPGGCTEGKEFNAYAHGSRVSRATVQHNAAAAARVKAF